MNQVVYYHEQITTNYVNSSFNTLSYLDVYIYDKYGFSLNSMGTDYSFSLEIQFLVD